MTVRTAAALTLFFVWMRTLSSVKVTAELPELARGLRQKRPDLPIIFISGSPDAQEMLGAVKISNFMFIQKPFLPSKFLEVVAGVLGPRIEP